MAANFPDHKYQQGLQHLYFYASAVNLRAYRGITNPHVGHTWPYYLAFFFLVLRERFEHHKQADVFPWFPDTELRQFLNQQKASGAQSKSRLIAIFRRECPDRYRCLVGRC